jgi:hypothetical protein
MGISYHHKGHNMQAKSLSHANINNHPQWTYALTLSHKQSIHHFIHDRYIHNIMHIIIHHQHIHHIIISCHTTSTITSISHSTNTYTTQNNWKGSLLYHKSANLHYSAEQPKTAQQQHRKITILSIRVLPSPIRVWPISTPIPYAYHLSHTRMLRVPLPHTRTNRDQTTFKTSSSSSIRVLPSAIRVWPETRFPDLLWFSLPRDSSDPTSHCPILHSARSYHLTRIIPYSISQILTILHLIPTNFLQL